jgi:hypothetical protein
MPPGYEDVASGNTLASVALEAGDLVYLDGDNGWDLATSTIAITGKQLGFAAQDYAEGRNDCSILLKGELEYGTGMTPGAPLFPGGVAGDLVDVAPTFYAAGTTPAVAVPMIPQIHAATATRIRFAF